VGLSDTFWLDVELEKIDGLDRETEIASGRFDNQAEALSDLICVCGDGPEGAITVLRDILAVFSQTDGGGNPYLNLEECGIFCKKYGTGVYHLIIGLLQNLGFAGHRGSVTSSAYLTPSGHGLRYLLESDEFVRRAYH